MDSFVYYYRNICFKLLLYLYCNDENVLRQKKVVLSSNKNIYFVLMQIGSVFSYFPVMVALGLLQTGFCFLVIALCEVPMVIAFLGRVFGAQRLQRKLLSSSRQQHREKNYGQNPCQKRNCFGRSVLHVQMK